MEASDAVRGAARFAAAWLTVALVAAPAQAQAPGPGTLTVHGNVERQLTLSVDDLRQLPV